jgi:hypothetical protein
MKWADIQAVAKKRGIKSSRIKKADLIRKIQEEEGNSPCFQMAEGSCDQTDCCWRKDCMG